MVINTCQNVSANHGQQGGAIDRKNGDEKLNRKLWDAQDNGWLVRRVEDGGDPGSDSEGDEPWYANDDTDNLDREDGVFPEWQAWSLS